MSKRSHFYTGDGQVMLLPVALGLGAGLLGALGWRLAVPRVYIDAGAPPANAPASDTAYFTIYDYLQYVGGPSWWPSILILPLGGMAIGVLTGSIAMLASKRWQALTVAVALSITGLLTGWGGALYAEHSTPYITVAAIADPTYTAGPPPSDSTFAETIIGGPPQLNLGPYDVLFPVTGAVVGLISGVVLLLILTRKRSSNPHHDR